MANLRNLSDVVAGLLARLVGRQDAVANPLARTKKLTPPSLRSGRQSRRDVLAYFGGVGAISAIALFGRVTGNPMPVVSMTGTRQSRNVASATEGANLAATSSSATATATPTPTATAISASLESTSTPVTAQAGSVGAASVPAKPSATPTAEATATSTPTSVPPPFGDVLGRSTISYAGAVPGRAANVELAARRINGAVLEPGESYSFLDHLGPQTLAAGFRIGYGVVMVDGAPRTAPMIGGGICDVSTVLFQAAFRAGLGIVERHNHFIWIEHYGLPPFGAIGLDATVDVQPIDLKLQNTTPHPLTIACAYQDATVSLELRGTDSGWLVTIGEPIVSHTVYSARTIVRQPDPTLPVGNEVVVETARPGFDVSWERQVMAGDRLVDQYNFTSRYLPSRNIVSVGTKGATATPTTTPSPTAVRTPKGSAAPGGTPTSSDQFADGSAVRVPSLVGLLETQAKPLIVQSGLVVTLSNYQGEGDVPAAALHSIGIGSILSQIPAAGAVVPTGTKVFLAVRKN